MPDSNPVTQLIKTRFLTILALIIGGETIFFLPFVLARVFRPTLLAVFDLTNFELGTIFSVYGIVAMVSYFFGGPLADKFQARKLISLALAATAIGGLLMATIPSVQTMKFLYGFWGMTTILLFWAALIRATREWGGKKLQGTAFGLLDGGRGLAAAIISSIGVVILAAFLPVDVSSATMDQKTKAFQYVIIFVSMFTFLVSVLVYFTLPAKSSSQDIDSNRFSLKGICKVISKPTLWLQAIIIVCAYVGYKTTDDFSLFAKEVLLFDDVKAAGVGTLALWMRPLVAITAGFLADKISASGMTILSFLLMFLGGFVISTDIMEPELFWLFFIMIITTSLGVYALRGLYFAIMEEGKIPLVYTGTAVGIISVIGYTPDIFMGPVMGFLLDKSPGPIGHQHVFMVFTGFSLFGMLTAILFRRFSIQKMN